MAENAERNLRLFRELITCTHDLYFWTYDSHFSMVYSSCPEPEAIGLIFMSVAKNIPGEEIAPILISSGLGFSWAVNMERDSQNKPLYYHVIGPVMASQVSMTQMKEAINRYRRLSVPLNESIDDLLRRIPTIPLTRMMEYGLMLHYCIYEEKLSISDFIYPETVAVLPKNEPQHTANPHGTWLMEQKLLNLITEGNLNYKKEATKIVTSAVPADLGNGDILRHYKNLNIAFTASCTRAAIRGGLSPEIAYLLSDKYIFSIEACNSLPEIVEVNSAMQDDFVLRVHQCKQGCLSPQIQQCCDYIQVHLEEPISLPSISNAIGYSSTWMSSKFRTETGKTITQYIAEQKVQRAKELLTANNTPVQEIADRLNFKSPSHFGDVFKRHTGMSPGEFRARRKEGLL